MSRVRAATDTDGPAAWMRRHDFPTISALLLALTVGSFSDNVFWRVHQKSNSDPKFIAHGLSCLAWMIVFWTQVNFVSRGHVRLRRRLGLASFCAAIAVTLSTAWVFAAVWKGWTAMSMIPKANRLRLPSFALFVWLGYRNRRDADRHTRSILVGTLCMVEPVISRAFDPLDVVLRNYPAEFVDGAWMVFAVVLWNRLFFSLFAYDRAVRGRMRPISILGFAWVWGVWGLVALL